MPALTLAVPTRDRMSLTRSQILSYIDNDVDRPLRLRDLARALDVPESDYTAFRRQIRQLERDGAVVRLRGNRYGSPGGQNLAVGRLTVNPDGFGFVSREDGSPDIFVSPQAIGPAIHGDRVVARVTTRAGTRNQPEGEVVRVLDRAADSVVGTFYSGATNSRGHGSTVRPDDPRYNRRVRIAAGSENGARDGQKVLVRITAWPAGRSNPEGDVVEILGSLGDPGVDILAIIREYGLPDRFPAHIEDAVQDISSEFSEEDLAYRRDLRGLECVTIDPDDARDHDDAVSLELNADGSYRLGVHIADVSHFVQEGTPLDHEAMARGTSVYLVDRVLPMLPERLSADMCSLLPGEDRLSITCFIQLSPDGEEMGFDLCESIIRSRARLTYTGVEDVLKDRPPAPESEAENHRDTLRAMENLRRHLTRRRQEQGALDFEIPESKVILDPSGRPIDVRREERLDSHRLIEEFMLLANRTVAHHMEQEGVPILYRVHDRPDSERLLQFASKAAAFGHRFPKADRIRPQQIRQFMDRLRGTRQGDVLSTFLLRSMKRAIYAPTNIGHFGLACDAYAHFTSPIRRYPDLLLHRQVRETMRAPASPQRISQLRERLAHIGELASHRERVAQEAEWDSIKLKQIEYLEDRIGEIYRGTIVGVRPIGFFVQLDKVLIDGLVHVSRLDDYYVFQEYGDVLRGERSGRTFRMGDAVDVQLIGADRHLRRIDFLVVEGGSAPKEQPSRNGKKRERPDKKRSNKKRSRQNRQKRRR